MSARFAALVAQIEGVQRQAIAPSSASTYSRCFECYKKEMMQDLETEPMPVTLEKIQAYLIFKKEQGRTFSTLSNYICAFSNHFRQIDEPNLTLSIEFKKFKGGLKRLMEGARFPNQKEPFKREWFNLLAERMDLSTFDDRLFFFAITLAYHFFMRVSEILSLRPIDVVIDRAQAVMSIHFWKTKTDQFATGTTSFLELHDDDISCPVHYADVLAYLDPNQPIFSITDQALNSRLRSRLALIGVENVHEYSFHSFRRGGAYHASERGVQDCVIKKHGRWLSDAYMRYVRVDAIRAGREIAAALAG